MSIRTTPLLGALALVTVALPGCTYTKEIAPTQSQYSAARSPNQQRLVALPATQAVQQACGELKLAQYAGKRVRVEVVGALPHTKDELLDYVAAAVEGEAAAAGAIVVPREEQQDQIEVVVTPQITVNQPPPAAPPPAPEKARPAWAPPPKAEEAAEPAAAPPAPPPAPPPAAAAPPQAAKPRGDEVDVRLVVAVDWGGIDIRDEKYVSQGKAAGQGLAGGASVVTLVIGIAAAVPPAAIIGGVGLLGSGVWLAASPPTAHSYTLMGRVQVTIRAVPTVAGLPAGVATGAAESTVVADPRLEQGFVTYPAIIPLKGRKIRK